MPQARRTQDISPTRRCGCAIRARPRARGPGSRAPAPGWFARETWPSFYDVLLTNARGAAADHQWQTAYDIARQVDDAYPFGTDVSKAPYAERDPYTSLVWLAGTVALKQLGRPADAMTMFDRYARGSLAPQTRAKGFYWAGRAAEAAGRRTDADAFLIRASGYRDQYYGQLATERLGRALAGPPPAPRPAIDPAVRQAFYARETVRAAQFLGQIGQWQDQTAFVKVIASDAETDTDHALADELSRSMGRPDLGVLVGRSAMQNGLTEYSANAFPDRPRPARLRGSLDDDPRDQPPGEPVRSRRDQLGGRARADAADARHRARAGGQLGLSYDASRLTTDTSFNVMLGSSYFQRIFGQYGSYPLAIAAL